MVSNTAFPDSVEPEYYPNTAIFVNLLNILSDKEADFTAVRSIDFSNFTQRPNIDEAATKLASCLGIINTYHPFPEGNGRAQPRLNPMLDKPSVVMLIYRKYSLSESKGEIICLMKLVRKNIKAIFVVNYLHIF